jgi:hypothetical protein
MAMDDGWSGSGFLATGRGTVVTANGNRTQDSVQLNAIFAKQPQGAPPNLDSEPDAAGQGSGAKYYTVQIGIRKPENLSVKAVGKVTWRTQGRFVTRRFDAGNGVVISGTAQAADVSVTDDTDVVGPAVATPYYVDILITPGCRPSTQQPPRFSIGTDVILAAGNETLSIPSDVGAISFNIQAAHNPFAAIAAGDLEVQLIDVTTGGVFASIDFTQLSEWEQLLPSVNGIKLINHSGASIIFSLTLGVEG